MNFPTRKDALARSAVNVASPIRNPKSEIRNHAHEEIDYDELLEPIRFSFSIDRRSFVQMLGAGVMITALGTPAFGQRRGGRGRGGGRGGPPALLSARIHFGDDGTITVLSGKVDGGQGARGQLALAAAEELQVPLSQMRVVLGDTSLCPNDGGTSGSGTTPRTVPAVRQAAAAVRKLLVDHAAEKWGVESAAVHTRDGRIVHADSKQSLSYADVVKDEALAEKFAAAAPRDMPLTPVAKWTTLGTEQQAPAARDKVLGKHEY